MSREFDRVTATIAMHCKYSRFPLYLFRCHHFEWWIYRLPVRLLLLLLSLVTRACTLLPLWQCRYDTSESRSCRHAKLLIRFLFIICFHAVASAFRFVVHSYGFTWVACCQLRSDACANTNVHAPYLRLRRIKKTNVCVCARVCVCCEYSIVGTKCTR